MRAIAASVRPVVRPLFLGGLELWIRLRTWGMRPDAPHHAEYALLRAKVRGGVRL